MDKSEYSHFHSFQDRKDALEEKIKARATELLEELWTSDGDILEAIKEGLAESEDYAAMVMYCHRNDSHALLGIITLELIDRYLSDASFEMAEDEL
jgi:hypothetical protein